MLTKEKVVKAMQTLPTKFSAEELFQHLLLLEGKTFSVGQKDDGQPAGEAENEASTDDFKEWASLA